MSGSLNSASLPQDMPVTLIGLAQLGLLLWVMSGLSLATNGSLDGTLAATGQGSRVDSSFKHLPSASLR